MNTNHLKKFAQEARRKLLELVGSKLEFVLVTKPEERSAELREKASQIKKLQEEINATSKEQVIEKVAYTWFNRLMALRFMDANDYQPIGIKVVTPKSGYTLPELLDEAKQGNIPDELPINQQHIYDVLDGRIPSSNPQNEAFKELLIGACNHLNKVFPFLFEKLSDYTELLLPDDLISEFSIVQDIREGMTEEDCKEVEIIGWLYQFYISEKKDEVFASKSKVKKEDIPAATQLFTPRWIVEYMVQNTMGKLWLQNKPNSKLREHMPYFIESPSVESEDYLKVNSVEEITLLDQACGSGHILVYGFELLTKIYEEEGYNPSEIPQLIIEKNLFGFEIDERAAQLAGMALMMKARSYQRRVFRKTLKPNILCFKDLKLTTDEIKETFRGIGIDLSDELLHDLKNMQQATNFGSLILPHTSLSELKRVKAKVEDTFNTTSDVFLKNYLGQFNNAFDQLITLGRKYKCTVANPPYMGGGKMNKDMSDWVKLNYPDSKSDLFSCFIERSVEFVPKNGFNGLVTMESWMFLSSYEALRTKLIENTKIHSLSHFGWHIMRIAFGTVTFILENDKPKDEFKGVYSYMEIDNIDRKKERPIQFPVKDNGRYSISNQKDFEKIPGSPLGYWVSAKTIEVYDNFSLLNTGYNFKRGIATGDNDRFIRFWFETESSKKDFVWFPYNKGGEYRKWFGNRFYLINWMNDGSMIKNLKDINGRLRSRPQNIDYNFQSNISYSSLTSGSPSFRFYEGFINDQAGNFIVPRKGFEIKQLIGLLNSKVSKYFIDIKSQTLNITAEEINSIPIPNYDRFISSESLIELSENEWDSKEQSWNFQENELLRTQCQDLEESYDLYQQYWKNKFFQLHKNEEELNQQFIEIYGLQDELTPEVPLEDITILKEETDIVNGELVFDAKEVFTQFMSYAVGCMFGRFSLDKEGLILSNQGETLEDYLKKVAKSEDEVSFLPDDDNIIPILDDEWFEDDIVNRFYEFLKVTFGEANFEKNLAFVEECLGKDIRKFFVKDFYKDHIKRYKKRPIYWMFSSPKGAFNVLIYMHRYTPDTLNQILNGYLKEYREKLNTHLEHLDHIIETGSSSEQTKASKEKDKLRLVLLELQEYERDVLYPLATERIAIDLDDGVLVNYNKFGSAIKPVAGLNDKKAKEKVMKFDWIDTSEIR